jgi:hypothetical protein
VSLSLRAAGAARRRKPLPVTSLFSAPWRRHQRASALRGGMLSPALHIRDVRMTFRAKAFLSLLGGATVFAGGLPALADKIKHPTVVLAGLDKITGRIITFDVAIDETVQFGTLQITPRVCYTRPPTEAPQTTTFVEVEDVTTSHETKRIFSGWMFAASPGLHAVEHPVYDIWLNDCRGGKDIIVTPPETVELREEAPPALPSQQARPRQQARPVIPGASLQTGAAPALGQVIEVAPAPGVRPAGQPAPPLPGPRSPESGATRPASPPPAARPPVPRELPFGALPPGNIPSGR